MLHDQNIETLRDEALRLVKLEINVLLKMMEKAGVLTEGERCEIQTLDRTTAQKHIEVLMGEQKKLDELEMVLAVVGTMKAGKSTTINAIVGTEVLPNRNRPMTALPTLIRHTPGQIEPVLKINNVKPIHNLLGILRKEFRKKCNAELLHVISTDLDMKEIISLIELEEDFQTRFEGANHIFVFLRTLNDLVRISEKMKIEFPFSDYDAIDELPVIEVEFAHLRGTPHAKGRLTLLDTPGPNESGQRHLRKMLKEQLNKASAVMAILDYTQLKSEADAEVRKDLSEIASVTEGRLFTLVNKFDQKDRNGDTAEEVKTFVAESLMEGLNIQSENVFPVSAKWAYLANRARHELHANKKLPDASNNSWVADFGEESFGRKWEEKVGNLIEVGASADLLWDDSLFHAPLEKIICTAHARAAVYAVDSTAAKLVDIAEKIKNVLHTRESSLSKSAHQLQSIIKALHRDINSIEKIEVRARSNAETMLNDLRKGTKQVFEAVEKATAASLKKYFKEGKRLEERTHKRKEEEADQQGTKLQVWSEIFAFAIGKTNANYLPSGTTDFDPNSPVMKFDERDAAISFIKGIEDSVVFIFDNAEIEMKKCMNTILNSFQEKFQDEVIVDAKKILNEMKGHLEKSGLKVELSIPSTSKLTLKFSGAEMLTDIVTDREKTVTRTRRQSGVWGSVCRWIGTSDWGWEDYQDTEQYFEVDILKIEKATFQSVEQSIEGLDKLVAAHVQEPLNDCIDKFFSGFKKSVEQIRGDLMQGIRDQEKSQAEQEKLMKSLIELSKAVPATLTDSRELKNDVQKHFMVPA